MQEFMSNRCKNILVRFNMLYLKPSFIEKVYDVHLHKSIL